MDRVMGTNKVYWKGKWKELVKLSWKLDLGTRLFFKEDVILRNSENTILKVRRSRRRSYQLFFLPVLLSHTSVPIKTWAEISWQEAQVKPVLEVSLLGNRGPGRVENESCEGEKMAQVYCLAYCCVFHGRTVPCIL